MTDDRTVSMRLYTTSQEWRLIKSGPKKVFLCLKLIKCGSSCWSMKLFYGIELVIYKFMTADIQSWALDHNPLERTSREKKCLHQTASWSFRVDIFWMFAIEIKRVIAKSIFFFIIFLVLSIESAQDFDMAALFTFVLQYQNLGMLQCLKQEELWSKSSEKPP